MAMTLGTARRSRVGRIGPVVRDMADGIGGLTGEQREKRRKKLEINVAYANVAYATFIDTIYT
jgi:hypothetical protein